MQPKFKLKFSPDYTVKLDLTKHILHSGLFGIDGCLEDMCSEWTGIQNRQVFGIQMFAIDR
jgi:hypothetical protein